MNVRKIALCILGIVLHKVYTHVAIIPYPYTNREYPLLEMPHQEKTLFSLSAVPFFRSAKEGFAEGGTVKNVSALFHGDDHFLLSDLSPEQKVLFLDSAHNQNYKDVLSPFEYIRYEGIALPTYQIFDKGVILGLDISKKKDDFSYKIQIRTPIIKREINHRKGWSAIEYQDEIEDQRLKLEDHNKHFIVRADYLSEQGIITPITRNREKNQGILLTDAIPEDYFLSKKNSSDIYNDTEEQIAGYHDFSFFRKKKSFDQSDNETINEEDIFAVTKFTDHAEPTLDSIDFFETLKNSIKKDQENILKKTTKGQYLKQDINWQDLQTLTFGPIDIQTGIDYQCFDDQGMISGLLSFVIPIKNKKENNYLDYGFFQDHYAIRLGSQCSYDINRHYKLVVYGSWQNHFAQTEMIPAIFENQTAFGLNPLFLKGKTSWNDIFFAADLVITYNKKYGGYVGYEFFKKTHDQIKPEFDSFHTVSGEIFPLNYTAWEKQTSANAHIFVCSAYAKGKQTTLSVEYKGVVNGKQIMSMQEINAKFGYEF
jgi:hypothetical protein